MIPTRPPVHASVAAVQATAHSELVDEVSAAIAAHKVVVVGVFGLAPGRRARNLLEAKKVPFHYLEYGSYLSGWRKRLALKIWVGWPTFPHIFVNGTFIGGASDLKKLIDSGEFDKLLA